MFLPLLLYLIHVPSIVAIMFPSLRSMTSGWFWCLMVSLLFLVLAANSATCLNKLFAKWSGLDVSVVVPESLLFSPALFTTWWLLLTPLRRSRLLYHTLSALCFCSCTSWCILRVSALSLRSSTPSGPTALGKLLIDCFPPTFYLSYALFPHHTNALWPAAFPGIIDGSCRMCSSVAGACAQSFLRCSQAVQVTLVLQTASWSGAWFLHCFCVLLLHFLCITLVTLCSLAYALRLLNFLQLLACTSIMYILMKPYKD